MYRWKTPVYLRALACLSFDTATWGDRERRDNPSCSLHARAPRCPFPNKNIGNERELKKDREDEIRKVKKRYVTTICMIFRFARQGLQQ